MSKEQASDGKDPTPSKAGLIGNETNMTQSKICYSKSKKRQLSQSLQQIIEERTNILL